MDRKRILSDKNVTIIGIVVAIIGTIIVPILNGSTYRMDNVKNEAGIVTQGQTGNNTISVVNINNPRRDLNDADKRKVSDILSQNTDHNSIIDFQFNSDNEHYMSQWVDVLINDGWKVGEQSQILSSIPNGITITSKTSEILGVKVLKKHFYRLV